VHGNDIIAPLINFYNDLKTNKTNLITRIRSLYPMTKDAYHSQRLAIYDSAIFFAINRSCFSGCMTGGFSGTRFTPSSIAKLETVDMTNLHVSCLDYETFLAKHPNTFAFLDPPYDCANLYLSDTFDHERLSKILQARQSDWLLCYNDTPLIRSLYADCEFIDAKWAYGMNTSRRSNEILIRPQSTWWCSWCGDKSEPFRRTAMNADKTFKGGSLCASCAAERK
jgi:site-specific DNA-adenine methylase